MIDLYILDKNLALVGIVDAYSSLIWAKRYRDVGDCEIAFAATPYNIALLQQDYYITRADDNMVCRIKKVEIDTSTLDGNSLIVTGYDVSGLLDQRIVWGTLTCDGNLESFIRKAVDKNCCNPSNTERQFQKENGDQLLYLGTSAGLKTRVTEQVSYKNVGEKIREYCQTYSWGYRIVQSGDQLNFEIYKGKNRSGSVFFSPNFENLATTRYISDQTHMGNVALIGGEGEGAKRVKQTYGVSSSLARYEHFVDAKDLTKSLTWENLTAAYPTAPQGGYGSIVGNTYVMSQLDIQIMDANHLAWLQAHYTGTIITDDGTEYYRILNVVIADLPSPTPDANTQVALRDLVYMVYLLTRGQERTSEYGETFIFEGTAIPDVTFEYKKDYFLGDLVTVENEFGISAAARIVEIIEVVDKDGYSLEPKFEYIGG